MEVEFIEAGWDEPDWRRWAIEQAVASGSTGADVLTLAEAIMEFVFPTPDAEAQFHN